MSVLQFIGGILEAVVSG